MLPTPNPDTHCPACHEPLSAYGHCWQCHYPPMDPKQDKTARPTKVVMLPTGPTGRQHLRCNTCGTQTSYAQPIALSEALRIVQEFLRAHEHPAEPMAHYCNGQCGICECISSPSTATESK